MHQIDETIWKVIPGHPKYRVNAYGEILSYSKKRGFKPIKNVLKRCGYEYARLTMGVWMQIHHAVLSAFVCPRPEGMVCRHLDGNRRNNHVSNLKWGTHMENVNDKFLHGTIIRGEDHYLSKLTNQQRIEIKQRWLNGESQNKLAKAYGVTQKSIFNQVHRTDLG